MSRQRNPDVTLRLCVLLAFSLFFWWSPILSTLRLAWVDDAYTHIILIVPLSVGLLYLNTAIARPRSSSLEPGPWKPFLSPVEPNRLGALFLLVPALVLAAWARWGASSLSADVRLSLSMLGLVLWWFGTFAFCFGFRILRLHFLPLCFLLWMVPWPDFLVNGTVQALQNGSALAARWLFQLARVPVAQSGIVVSIHGLDLEVTRECSSIRSSNVLVITTMVLAYLFLRSWWGRLLLVLLAIPLSIAKNGLRIFVIGELGTRVDPGYLNGNLHRHGGVVFLAIGELLVILFLWLLRRTETLLAADA